MAASSFALACDALARERDRVFLVRVSADYNIPYEELEAKYLVEAQDAIKVPKVKKARKAKVEVEGGPPKCQAQTAKKAPCSFAALKGECFCKRHLKTPPEGNAPAQDPVPLQPKKDPVHTHPVDDEFHDDCDLCQTHGNPMEDEPEFEIAEESEFDDE